MSQATFVYVTYIRTTLDELWSALTDTEFMRKYWFGTHCESQWTAGSSWKHVSDGQLLDSGAIVEAEPPRRMVIRWQNRHKPELEAEGDSLCTLELEPVGATVKLSVRHGIERESSELIQAVSDGWPKVISNLKSLLETGSIVLQEPYQPKASFGNHASVLVPRQAREDIRRFYCDVLGGKITKADPERPMSTPKDA